MGDFLSLSDTERGIVFIGLSFILVVITLYRKESLRMKDHNTASWEAYVNQLVLIITLLICGVILIMR
jgi:hypothetical protein